jgi:hypothetical protein
MKIDITCCPLADNSVSVRVDGVEVYILPDCYDTTLDNLTDAFQSVADAVTKEGEAL